MSRISLEINDLVQIRILGDGTPSAYPSRVDDIVDGRPVLNWPTSAGVRVPMCKDQSVSLYFFREDAVYTVEGLVEDAILEPVPRIVVQPVGRIQRIQRRECFRVRAMLPVQLTGTVVKGDPSSGEQNNVLNIVTHTMDISGTGLAIHHKDKVPPGTMFETKLTLEKGKPPLKLLSRVVYSDSVAGLTDRNIYRIAVTFVAITEAQRSAIMRRAFRIQQEAVER